MFAGVLYLLAGTVFLNPPASNRAQFIWRLAAWIISAVTFCVHAWYELFRLHSPPRRLAIHVSTAVALGAVGLAVAANIHALSTGTGNRQLLILAVVIWPILTAVPAFAIAFIAAKAFAWFGFVGRPKKP
jgi:hypothetical protein